MDLSGDEQDSENSNESKRVCRRLDILLIKFNLFSFDRFFRIQFCLLAKDIEYRYLSVTVFFGGNNEAIFRYPSPKLKMWWIRFNGSSLDNDLPQYIADTDDSGVRFSIPKNKNLFLSNDPFIVIVASSVSIPLPSHIVFDFLRSILQDWDKFCDGNPWHEIPLVSPPKDGVKIIQECFIDPLGSYVVYSPLNTQELNMAINGHDLSNVSLIIPSGFLISEDSKSLSKDSKSRGSLLTVAFH
ncbi:hypothetical protein MTR_2g030710 [Medicago truncatula]|uniref:HD-Zip IV C-terminal domain-containing protein n=1 Tax=Medicago truncatula TaxID=3880 RepID=G7IMI6_MEDTR|nr:hypothetical protein MTR_2g030710 [Medicago truncatula]